jgi:hypothetical protein
VPAGGSHNNALNNSLDDFTITETTISFFTNKDLKSRHDSNESWGDTVEAKVQGGYPTGKICKL